MTEAEWLTSDDPVRMLSHLRSLGTGRRASGQRKLRLFACACYRECNATPSTVSIFADIEAQDGKVGFDGLSNKASELAKRWAEVSGEFFAPFARRAEMLRELFGNPFRPVVIAPTWLTADVLRLAKSAHESRAWGELPILADALEDAGCGDEALLAHLRGAGPHLLGCWALDSVRG